MPARISFCDSVYFLTAVVSAATAAVSTATVSTATTVESVAGASLAAFGAHEAKANATTKNKITFFIFFLFLKFNMFVFAIQNRCKDT